MKGSSFGYLIRIGIRSIFRNRLMSFAAIGVLMACMMLIGAAGLLSLNVQSVVDYIEDQNEVMVFAYDRLDEQGLAALDADLRSTENIFEVEFISREEGFDQYKEKLEVDGIFDELTPDFLPNSYRVRIDDLSMLSETVARIENYDGVEKVNSPTDIADIVVEIKHAVYVSGFAIIGILAVVALIIIANTIKVTVFNRRKEINIMKFVGATDPFIRLPFVVEGMVIGLIAAAIAFFVVWGAYEYLISWMEGNQSPLYAMFGGQIIPFKTIALQMGSAFAGAGTFIGVGGSLIFVRRYLRV